MQLRICSIAPIAIRTFQATYFKHYFYFNLIIVLVFYIYEEGN